MTRRSEKIAKLKRQYLNPKQKYSFAGKPEFEKNVGKKEKRLISKVLASTPAYTLHRKAILKFKRRRIFIPSIDNQWVLDLLEIGKYSRKNKNYRYLLTCIDGFSRYAWVEPIKSKQASKVAVAFQKILDRAKPRKPKLCQFDLGKEFYGKSFLNLLKSNNIKHFSVQSELKASLIEVFNKTLFTRIARYMTHKNSTSFINVLPQFVKNYNNTFHKGIKAIPNQVNKSNEKQIFENQYGSMPLCSLKKSKYSVGQKVLISKIRGHFEKGYTTHFNPEIFFIDRIGHTEPCMYYLRDSSGEPVIGGFYEQQILPISHS